MSSSTTSSLLMQAGLAAAISAAGLALLQSDSVSRFLLTPDRLRQKRRNEYRYRWQRALELARMQIQYARFGGDQQYSEGVEKLSTVKVDWLEEVQDLVEQVYAGKQDGISIDRVGTDGGEVYVWLGSEAMQYQVPLLVFVEKMEDALDRHVTTATFCFVSDASGGDASSLIERLVRVCFEESMAVLGTPVWFVQLAVLIDQAQILTGKVEQVLSCLCRLHAHLRRCGKSISTILYVVPTSLVPTLSGWLQEAFPDDRHVFGYTGCLRAIEYGLSIKSHSGSLRGDLPTLTDALQWTHPVATTTPLSKRGVETSSCVVPAAFVEAAAKLPHASADLVEAWMSAVDAFLALKENDKANGYTPYVCRLDYLYSPGSGGAPVMEGSDRYWSVRSLLQFVTGSQNRELPDGVTSAAVGVLGTFDPPHADLAPSSAAARRAIESAVFQHKRILIENKTLLDTVRPAKHWTLRAAARKGGCSCCAPDDDDEEDEEEDEVVGAPPGDGSRSKGDIDPVAAQGNRPGAFGYVDGKTTFAFDPSRFS